MISKSIFYWLIINLTIMLCISCNGSPNEQHQDTSKEIIIIRKNYNDSTIIFLDEAYSPTTAVTFTKKMITPGKYEYIRTREKYLSEATLNDSTHTLIRHKGKIIFKDKYGIHLTERQAIDAPTINRLIRWSESVKIIGNNAHYYMTIKMQDTIGSDIINGYGNMHRFDSELGEEELVEIDVVNLHFSKTMLKWVEITYNTDYKDVQLYHYNDSLLTRIEYISYSYELDHYFHKTSNIYYDF